jgi:tRNA G18 (ribose-2'-O)-methylase SpoU
MQTTYRLRADELSADIIKALKNTYHSREIVITVDEAQDETEYLLSSPANREHLLAAIDDVRNNRNLVTMPLESLGLGS